MDGACHSVLELFLEITTPASLSSSFWNAIQSSFCIQVSWDPKLCTYSSKVWDPQDVPLPGQGYLPGSCCIQLHGHQLTAIHSHWAMQSPGRAVGTVAAQAATPSWRLGMLGCCSSSLTAAPISVLVTTQKTAYAFLRWKPGRLSQSHLKTRYWFSNIVQQWGQDMHLSVN